MVHSLSCGTHMHVSTSQACLSSVSVLLGIGEAGFYAGVVYYLSFWYTR